MTELQDIHRKPLKEGFYLRNDKIFQTHSIQTLVYLNSKDGKLYQESLTTPIRPLFVSPETTFQPLSESDLDWLRQKLKNLEQIASS
jgi:hypothetical protein